MSDLISRAELQDAFDCDCPGKCNDCSYSRHDDDVYSCALIDDAPAVDAVSPGVVEQYKWERDTALAQLAELGIGFCEKMPEMERVRHGRWIENGECEWYGKDMLLSECNARKLLEFLEQHEVFERWEIYEAVLKSLREGGRVYINADWQRR